MLVITPFGNQIMAALELSIGGEQLLSHGVCKHGDFSRIVR
jgi:hypothetical protein